jgi:hypothetical protein
MINGIGPHRRGESFFCDIRSWRAWNNRKRHRQECWQFDLFLVWQISRLFKTISVVLANFKTFQGLEVRLVKFQTIQGFPNCIWTLTMHCRQWEYCPSKNHHKTNEMVQGPCAHLRFKCWDMGIVMTNVVLDDWWAHSRSNSNKTSQLCNMCFELWPVTLKSMSNQKPRYYGMYPCTYDTNLEMIQPLVQELYQFLFFWSWPPGG